MEIKLAILDEKLEQIAKYIRHKILAGGFFPWSDPLDWLAAEVLKEAAQHIILPVLDEEGQGQTEDGVG